MAQRAEFGKGTLYNYFPDGKEELLRAVLDELFEEMEDLLAPFLNASVETTAEFRAALHDYLSRSATYFQQHQSFFRLLMREAWRLRLSSVEQRREYLHAQLTRSVTRLSAVIDRAIDAGALRPFPPSTLAYIILSIVPNHVSTYEATGWPSDPMTASDEAATFLTSLLMDGLAP